MRSDKVSQFEDQKLLGTLIMEPERSVTAAMTVYLPDMKLHLNWKLSPELSIMGAVLHAIYQAILYVS